MKQFFFNIIQALSNDTPTEKDSADLVQTIILIAGFSAVAIAVVGWISTALFGVGADTAKCISDYGEGIFFNISNQCYDGVRFHSDGGFSSGTTNIDKANCDIESSAAYRSRFGSGGDVTCGSELQVRE